MRKTTLVGFILLVAFLVAGARAYAAGFPVQQVDAVLGRSAQQLPGSVYKYSWPRSDLMVKVAGTAIAPGLALGSWAAFAPRTDNTWVMGDLVLLQSETGPVIDKLQAGGFSITGVHNHLMNEIPRVMYVHYMGEGGAVELARVLKDALGQSHTPMGPAAHPAASQKTPGWVTELQSALGRTGKLNGPVLGVSIDRADDDKVENQIVPPVMGLQTALNFQDAGGKVASTGDFVLIASEVNVVIRTLHQHGITVTALHNHMLDDSPHLFFMHYWALDDPARVGEGLKAALTEMNLKQQP